MAQHEELFYKNIIEDLQNEIRVLEKMNKELLNAKILDLTDLIDNDNEVINDFEETFEQLKKTIRCVFNGEPIVPDSDEEFWLTEVCGKEKLVAHRHSFQ